MPCKAITVLEYIDNFCFCFNITKADMPMGEDVKITTTGVCCTHSVFCTRVVLCFSYDGAYVLGAPEASSVLDSKNRLEHLLHGLPAEPGNAEVVLI